MVHAAGASSSSTRTRPARSAISAALRLRGRAAAIGMVAARRPGLPVIATTSSARKTASSMEWVTNRMVLPVAAWMRASSPCSDLARDRVERGERLVHQQDVGLDRERPRQRHPLALTAGQLMGITAGIAGQSDQRQRRLRLLAPLVCAEAAVLEAEADIAHDLAPGQQPRDPGTPSPPEAARRRDGS